ncbi:MAG: hypothetical protein KDD35_01715, partial [Bdellovibrionales bacterium]|nr:hypothetical protein [Bdellovibrionales bacterium]
AIRWTQVPNDYYDQLLTVFLGHLAWVGLWGLFFNFVEETLLIQLYGRYAKPNGELPQSIETFLGYGVQASFYLFCFGSYYWIFFKK